jgi:hypothetical protein
VPRAVDRDDDDNDDDDDDDDVDDDDADAAAGCRHLSTLLMGLVDSFLTYRIGGEISCPEAARG